MPNIPHHADIQNALLIIMEKIVQEKICSDVQSAGVFSLLADETKDISKREQLAIVLRYVNSETNNIHESFLTYVEATSLNAESLSARCLEKFKVKS